MPKAVLPTDLYGQCANMNRILDVCRPFGIPVVSDAAEALGAKYKRRTDKDGNGWDEKPLFDDRIEAWANGPVVPSLFGYHKGMFSIDAEQILKATKTNLSHGIFNVWTMAETGPATAP